MHEKSDEPWSCVGWIRGRGARSEARALWRTFWRLSGVDKADARLIGDDFDAGCGDHRLTAGEYGTWSRGFALIHLGER